MIIKTIGNTTQQELNINGQSVLELLKLNHNIKMFNQMLKCIDEVCIKNNFWWQFKVNDQLILKSVDRYYPQDGDIIKFEYGEEE